MVPGFHCTRMFHEGPEHQVLQMVRQGPEYHYNLEVREVQTIKDMFWTRLRPFLDLFLFFYHKIYNYYITLGGIEN